MIVAIIADVHSNNLALARVLQDARDQSATEVWFLGDLVGYGPLPLPAWKWLLAGHPPCRWALAGNHDWGLIGRLGAGFALPPEPGDGTIVIPTSVDFNRVAMDTLSKNATSIPQDGGGKQMRGWLSELPLIASPHPGVYLAHGAFVMKRPENCLKDYVTLDQEAEASWQSLRQWLDSGLTSTAEFVAGPEGWHQPRLMIVGHWHRQLAWRRDPARSGELAGWQRLIPGFGAPPNKEAEPETQPPVARLYGSGTKPQLFEISSPGRLMDEDAERPTIVNPGSVGLPRDGARAGEEWAWAKYALIDWNEPGGRLRFRQVPYRVRPILDVLSDNGYPPEIAHWLTR